MSHTIKGQSSLRKSITIRNRNNILSITDSEIWNNDIAILTGKNFVGLTNNNITFKPRTPPHGRQTDTRLHRTFHISLPAGTKKGLHPHVFLLGISTKSTFVRLTVELGNIIVETNDKSTVLARDTHDKASAFSTKILIIKETIFTAIHHYSVMIRLMLNLTIRQGIIICQRNPYGIRLNIKSPSRTRCEYNQNKNNNSRYTSANHCTGPPAPSELSQWVKQRTQPP